MKKKILLLLPLVILLLVLFCTGWAFPQCAFAFALLFTISIISLLAYILYRCVHRGLHKAFKNNVPHLCQTAVFRSILGLLCALISLEGVYRFSVSSLGHDVARRTRTVFSLIENAVGYKAQPQKNESSSDKEPPVEQETSITPQQPVHAEQLYAPILEKYKTALTQGYDMWQLEDAGLNYMCVYHDDASEIGYAFLDVDQNGTPELLIGEIVGEEYFFDYYTIIEDTCVLVAQSTERDRYYLCTDGAIANEGSNSAFDGFNAYYTVGAQGQLILSEAVIYDENYSSDSAWYSTSSISAEGASPLSWESAELIYKKHEYVQIEYVSFFPDGSPKSAAAEPFAVLERADIEALLAADVPPFVAAAGENVDIDLQSDDVALIHIPLQSAIPDAFTVAGTVDILAVRDSNGNWSAETYQKNCDIITSAEKDRKIALEETWFCSSFTFLLVPICFLSLHAEVILIIMPIHTTKMTGKYGRVILKAKLQLEQGAR